MMAMKKRTGTQASRRLRIDAQRNRQHILTTARETFAEMGVGVGMTDIAKRAGLGIGTMYRHFPNKEALVDALLRDQLATATQTAKEAAAGEMNPWDALEAFLRTMATLLIENRSLSQFIGGRIPGSAELRKQRNALFKLFSELTDNAQRAGELRADIEANDIRVAMICIVRAVWGDWPDTDWVVQRYLGLILDGLRAPGRTRLGGQPPSTKGLGLAKRQDRQSAAFKPGPRQWDK
jgi:AcrR family transcriptional regulator